MGSSAHVFQTAMKFPEMRPRQPLIGPAFAAIFGIALADHFAFPLPLILVAVVVGLVIVLVCPRTWSCWTFVAMVFLALHVLRHQHSDARRLAAEFSSGSRVVRASGIVWSEPEPPVAWSRTVTARFRLKLESIEFDGRYQRPSAFVNVSWAGALPAYGDRVAFTAAARNLEAPRNPGGFDFTGYLRRQGIFSELRARFREDCAILDRGHGLRLQRAANTAQQWIRERLELDLADAPEIAALIESMVLGLRGETPTDVKEMFQRTGTLHLFAVSGLNVAMLATIAWFILKPLGVGRKLAVFLIIPILAAYALVTGLSASCVRATIMGTLLLIGFLVDRPGNVYNSLAAAGLGILAWDTNQLFAPGFQFSFVLVFTIVWLSGRIQRRCEKWGQPDAFLPRPLWSWRERLQASFSGTIAAALGVTLSAWIGSLLFTAGYFHLFSPAAIVANLIAVPLAFAVLALGVSALLSATLWTVATIWFNNANWLCAKALLAVVQIFAKTPGGHIYVELPTPGAAPACEFTVFDLDDGGATHLRADGRDWLLDCGHGSRYNRVVLPYLRSRGVNQLDGLLLSHGDAQHIGAAVDLIKDFNPREIVDSALKDRSSTRRALHLELVAKHFGKSLRVRGDVLSISSNAQLRVLFPQPGLVRSVADDKALVVRLECGGRRVLFMSDSGFATEQWLLENEPDLRADLLVKGHHAKDLSGTLEFLARVQPQAVVCSSLGYGVPPKALDEWTQRVTTRGIPIFRQDECGAARVELRGDSWIVRGFVNGQTFTSRAR